MSSVFATGHGHGHWCFQVSSFGNDSSHVSGVPCLLFCCVGCGGGGDECCFAFHFLPLTIARMSFLLFSQLWAHGVQGGWVFAVTSSRTDRHEAVQIALEVSGSDMFPTRPLT